MIPISDDNPVRLTPFMTWILIALCVLVFGWQTSLGEHGGQAYLKYGFIPDALFGPEGSPSSSVVSFGLPVLLTVVTSMFLHGGFLHLAGNLLYLWIFGNNIEDAMGHARFVIFYLVCGAAAAMSMAFMDPTSQVPMVGASGAISGVLGAYMLIYPRARVTVIIPLGIIFYPFRIAAIWVVGLWFITQLVSAALTPAAQPGIAWWAHVGGFIGGLVLTPVLKSSHIPYFGSGRKGPWAT